MKPHLNKVMVVVAHPDDAEINCGGTVAKWSSEGKEIFYVICTSGDKGTPYSGVSLFKTGMKREEEQLRAAKLLGVKEVKFLRYLDGELKQEGEIIYDLVILIRKYRPNIILTHDPWKEHLLHPDHKFCGLAVIKAIIKSRDPSFYHILTEELNLTPHSPREVYFFNSSSSNVVIDISKFFYLKLKALSLHSSQTMRVKRWGKYIFEESKKIGKKKGVNFGEEFKKIKLLQNSF
jgi:LmbE family N-acetylglucosaminyl deacetylase